jgi:hypothetical protein
MQHILSRLDGVLRLLVLLHRSPLHHLRHDLEPDILLQDADQGICRAASEESLEWGASVRGTPLAEAMRALIWTIYL